MTKCVKAFLLLVSLVSSLGYALASARDEGGDAAQRGRAARARARELFVSNCARCHGADGKGQTRLGQSMDAPDMTDRAWHAGRSDARLRDSILKGRDEMPAFDRKLSKSDAAALVAYVRSFRRR